MALALLPRVSMGSYAVLEDMAVADCALDIDAESVGDLFVTSARALAELMVDPATITPGTRHALQLEAASLDLLLFDWLSELIFLKDSEQFVTTAADVTVRDGSPWRLRAYCTGGRIQRGRTVLRADPKAVTFHHFTVERRGEGWHARIVIDI